MIRRARVEDWEGARALWREADDYHAGLAPGYFRKRRARGRVARPAGRFGGGRLRGRGRAPRRAAVWRALSPCASTRRPPDPGDGAAAARPRRDARRGARRIAAAAWARASWRRCDPGRAARAPPSWSSPCGPGTTTPRPSTSASATARSRACSARRRSRPWPDGCGPSRRAGPRRGTGPAPRAASTTGGDRRARRARRPRWRRGRCGCPR